MLWMVTQPWISFVLQGDGDLVYWMIYWGNSDWTVLVVLYYAITLVHYFM